MNRFNHSPDTCQWAIDNNVSDPRCHKDFCACIREKTKLWKKRKSKVGENIYLKIIDLLNELKVIYVTDTRTKLITLPDVLFIYSSTKKLRFKGKDKYYEFGTTPKLLNFIRIVIEEKNLSKIIT